MDDEIIYFYASTLLNVLIQHLPLQSLFWLKIVLELLKPHIPSITPID